MQWTRAGGQQHCLGAGFDCNVDTAEAADAVYPRIVGVVFVMRSCLLVGNIEGRIHNPPDDSLDGVLAD